MSWTWTLLSTAQRPISSVAPWVTPPRIPPPASHIVKPYGIVVAAVAAFAHRRAAELAAPDDERAVEHAALLQVFQQAGDRAIGFAAVARMVAFHVGMGVPFAAGAEVELHEPHAALDQPAGQQAVAAGVRGFFLVEAVEAARFFRFVGQVDDLRRGRLHAIGQLVGGDARFELIIFHAAARDEAR